MKMNVAEQISTMDLSNLTDDQLAVVNQLAVAAAYRFDFLASQARESEENLTKGWESLRAAIVSEQIAAVAKGWECTILRDRMEKEIKNRAAA